MVLGSLWTQIHELQARSPQASTVSTSLVAGTLASEEMLRTKMTNIIVLLDGEFMMENEADIPIINSLKGVRLNMVVLPWEMLYPL